MSGAVQSKVYYFKKNFKEALQVRAQHKLDADLLVMCGHIEVDNNIPKDQQHYGDLTQQQLSTENLASSKSGKSRKGKFKMNEVRNHSDLT